MSVKEVMQTQVATLFESATVREAARLLRDCGYSSLPVTDADGRLVGTFSDHQLLHFALPDYAGLAEDLCALPPGFEPNWESLQEAGQKPVRDVMGPTHSVSAETSIVATMALMAAEKVQAVFVTDSGKLVGVVTRDRVLKKLIYPAILRGEET